MGCLPVGRRSRTPSTNLRSPQHDHARTVQHPQHPKRHVRRIQPARKKEGKNRVFINGMTRLSTDERKMLLRVSETLLVLRDSNLAWVDPSGATAVAAGEHELLRGLWRGDLIRLPEGTESDRVTLTLSGHRVVQELRVFGEPEVVSREVSAR